MKRAILILALAGLLGACSSNGAEIGDFVVEDLENARSMATRPNDIMALQCYDYLLPRLEARLDIPEDEEISGAISAWQKARNIRLLIEELDSTGFRMACGPMLMDSESVLRRWGINLLAP